MKTKKKLMLISALVVIVAALSIGLTMAYLSDLTAPVTNTFTVGNVHITLSEPNWNPTAEHKLVPSAVFPKSPTVVVMANGENCYVAASVTIPASLDPLIALNYNTANWTFVKSIGTVHYFKYNDMVPLSVTNTTLAPLFTTVTVNNAVTNDQLAALGSLDKQLTVQAFAIQAAGFTSQDLALAEWIPAA